MTEEFSEEIWIGRTALVWGSTVHFHSIGSGETVLLLHGNGSLGQEIACAFPDVPGVRWVAPDRPGYGLSDPLPKSDPMTGGAWIAAFCKALDIRKPITLVAHSIGCAPALFAAAAYPHVFRRVLLMAPFCRPIRERLMLHLRAAVAPVIGPSIRRYIVPHVVRRLRRKLIAAYLSPHDPTRQLRRFPIEYAARSLPQAAAELRAFNAAMRASGSRLRVRVPVTVISAKADRTARPDWHLPWLEDRLAGWTKIVRVDTGHGVHHEARGAVLREILSLE